MEIEWSQANQYNSFNSAKGLCFYEHYKKIVAWMGGKGVLPPPIECNLDPIATCNLDCYFCFDKDENITMGDLTHKKISEMQVGDEVLGFDENKRTVKTKVLNVFDNGRMDWLYKITFQDGNSIICTKDHKIWKASRAKWSFAKDLRVGHTVKKVLYYDGSHDINNRDYKEGYLAGVALGDGCMNIQPNRNRKGGHYDSMHYQFRLVQKDNDAMERFGQYCTDLGIKWRWNEFHCKYEYKGKKTIKHYKALYINNNDGCKTLEGFEKRDIESSQMFKIGWVAGIYDAEGSTSTGIRIHQKHGTPTSEKIKRMVGSLGYRYKEEKCGIRLFADAYGIFNFLMVHKPAIIRKVNKLYLRRDPYSGMLITKIERIRGRRRVFDLETETHNYFVKGVLVHNCVGQRYIRDHREEVAEMGELPDEYMIRLVDFLAAWGVKGLCLSGGGEPTLHRGLSEVIRHAYDKGMKVSLFTNAVRMTRELAEAIALCQWVSLSVDACDVEMYQKIKGADKFVTVLDNIRSLVAFRAFLHSDVNLTINYLVLPENQSKLYEACKLFKNLGVQTIHYRPVDFERSDIKGARKLPIDIQSVNEQFAKCHEEETPDYRVFTITHKFDKDFHVKHDFTKCLATPLVVPILTDGNAYLCVDRKMEQNFQLGSCYPDPELILKWWGSDKHRELIRSVNINNCSRCTWSQYNKQISEVVLKDGMCLSFP